METLKMILLIVLGVPVVLVGVVLLIALITLVCLAAASPYILIVWLIIQAVT